MNGTNAKHCGALALFASLILAATNAPAQFVEVEATFDVTSWRYNEETGLPLKNSRNFSVRCVVGTNLWLIENNSRTNYKESIWFVNGRIIRQLNAPIQDPIPDDSLSTFGRRSGRYANITASEDGYPASDMFVNLPWFAFCSGPYLGREGRSLPLPVSEGNRSVFGFKDKTATFNDTLGLPKEVDLFTSKGQLKAEYRVQQSTNVLRWNFPTAFTVVQNEPDQFDQWRRQLTATGRVTGIRAAPKPTLPQEIQSRLDYLDRLPTRRR